MEKIKTELDKIIDDLIKKATAGLTESANKKKGITKIQEARFYLHNAIKEDSKLNKKQGGTNKCQE